MFVIANESAWFNQHGDWTNHDLKNEEESTHKTK